MNSTSTIKSIHFSLVELLVVVAVLTVLLSLLSPSLQSTIRTAKMMACASNLKSNGVLFETFANDHNDEYLSTEKLFKRNGHGHLAYTDPMIRRSFKGWAADLRNYSSDIKEIIYCPDDTTTDAANKSTENNANVSYEFKGILVDLSRGSYKRSVRSSDFGIPERQSLLISRGTWHSDVVKGHHSKRINMLYLHNIYYVDGHVALDFTGYNHPNILSGTVSWLHYPVFENNKKARGNTDYLEKRCEVTENAL